MRDSPAGRRRYGRSARAAVFLGVASALAALASGLVLTGQPVAAGLAAAGGAAGLLAGTVEARGSGDTRARFTEALVDRLFDASVLGSLAWVWRLDEPRVTALALLSLGAAFTASYQRAKAVSLGYRASESMAYRTARTVLPVAGLLIGSVEASLWALAVLTVAAAGGRALDIAGQHGRERKLGHSGSVRGS